MMTYADHVYRSADGRLDLYARIYDADGPPLLLMHGLTRNSADFEGAGRTSRGQISSDRPRPARTGTVGL